MTQGERWFLYRRHPVIKVSEVGMTNPAAGYLDQYLSLLYLMYRDFSPLELALDNCPSFLVLSPRPHHLPRLYLIRYF